MYCSHDSKIYRGRSGPTGNKIFMILVDRCSKCGCLFPVNEKDLTWKQKDWIERYNKHALENYEKGLKEENDISPESYINF